MEELIDTCPQHDYAILEKVPYRDQERRRYIVKLYRCVHCGAGMHVYVPEEDE